MAMGTSDHCPSMPGPIEKTFFENYRIFPDSVDGVRLLKGMEANIMDFDGNLDGGQVMATIKVPSTRMTRARFSCQMASLGGSSCNIKWKSPLAKSLGSWS